jgi:hypothetical protein
MRLKKSRAARQKIVCDMREVQSLEEASGNAIISTNTLNK